MKRTNELQDNYEKLRKLIDDHLTSSAETTVMFADLANSTDYKSERILIPSLLKVYRHNTEVRNQVRRLGGTVVKSLGDGVLATFPVSDPEDAGLAVQAAIAVQKHFHAANEGLREDERILSRIGIACGPVVDFASVNPEGERVGDPQGPVVDLAARLCSMAAPQQIVCDDATVQHIGRSTQRFDLSPAVLRIARGFAKAVSVRTVNWGGPTGASPVGHSAPLFRSAGFLTTEFVAERARAAERMLRVVGFSNRHFSDNIDLFNTLHAQFARFPHFRFELFYLSPVSPHTAFARVITRRGEEDVAPAILRNIQAVCKLFAADAEHIGVYCADFPMAIPQVQMDEIIFFAPSFRSRIVQGRREGVVGGPYFAVHAESEVGERVRYTLANDNVIEIPIRAVAKGDVTVNEVLSSDGRGS